MTSELRFAVVCASNMNRSMEAHSFLSRRGFNVKSYGTGKQVKLPGPAIDMPNVYEFGTPYRVIYDDLVQKDFNFYTHNGILGMVDRNRRVKEAPEKFQATTEQFDIIITVEERIFDTVIEYLDARDDKKDEQVHVINIDIPDNHEDATIGAGIICTLATRLAACEDWVNDIEELVDDFEHKIKRPIHHGLLFY